MPGVEDGYKLVRARLVIDGRGVSPVERGAVLIEGSTIRAVGREADIRAPDGVPLQVLDYPDKAILPGLIDCHTHHNGFGDGRLGDDLAELPDEVLTLQSARNARSALFTGVTSVRENGPKNLTMFRLRDAIREGRELGPRMVLCGRPLSIIGGHMGYFGSAVTGPTEARAMVRQLIKEGADYIKIVATGGSTVTSDPLRPAFNVDELQAIVEEAHKFGVLTATHCLSTQGTINSLDAGVDMIIHCVFKEADGMDVFREDVAERIVSQGAFVNPTLHVSRAKIWALQERQERGVLTPEEQRELEQHRRDFETRLEHCGRLIEMGAKVITGSDSSWGWYKLGNTAYETECLVMAGYSTKQGVASVTGMAAEALGIDQTVGTLEPGKQADIIVVDGDPTQDIRALWNVTDVFLGGQRIDRGSGQSVAATRQRPPAS